MPSSIKLLSLVFFVLCSSCATLDKGECQTADWNQIGFADGAKGMLADNRLKQHSSACDKHNIVPDEPLYRAGHGNGVIEYCTPEQGRKLGRAGKEYNNICPSPYARDFLGEYISGLTDELNSLDNEEERAEEDLSQANLEYSLVLLQDSTAKRRKNRKSDVDVAKSRLRNVKSDQINVRRLISEWSRKLADLS